MNILLAAEPQNVHKSILDTRTVSAAQRRKIIPEKYRNTGNTAQESDQGIIG